MRLEQMISVLESTRNPQAVCTRMLKILRTHKKGWFTIQVEQPPGRTTNDQFMFDVFTKLGAEPFLLNGIKRRVSIRSFQDNVDLRVYLSLMYDKSFFLKARDRDAA